MHQILHQITINAPADKVYDALTTEEGLKSWWTADTVAEPKIGSIAEFGFFNRATVFRMEIEELIPGKNVIWKCLGEPEEWKGTELTFELSPADGGGTKVQFCHEGWSKTNGDYPLCNTTWGHLMYFLKDYLEGVNNKPFFK